MTGRRRHPLVAGAAMPPLQVVHPTPSDIEIAQAAQPVPIATVAERLGLEDADYEPYGHLKAKVCWAVHRRAAAAAHGPGCCCLCKFLCPALSPTVATLLHRLLQVRLEVRDKLADVPSGKYIVVAGITPTPLGEGKR